MLVRDSWYVNGFVLARVSAGRKAVLSMRVHPRMLGVWSAMILAATLIFAATQAEAQSAMIDITLPSTDGERVEAGGFTVRGNVSGQSGLETYVVFAVDVSGSTDDERGLDCDGSGTVDLLDDFNGDGVLGELLDCEIAGLIALNQSLASIPGSNSSISVALVPFGHSARAADVGEVLGFQSFVRPQEDYVPSEAEELVVPDAKDLIPDIVEAASSMNQGVINQFTRYTFGTGTDFDDALNASFDLLEPVNGRKIVFMLSDGQDALRTTTLDRGVDLGIEVRPFAISSGSDQCSTTGALFQIAESSGTTCVYTEDPAQLTTAIVGQPSQIDSISVSVDGGAPVAATVDPLGNFEATVQLDVGFRSIRADLQLSDGTGASVVRMVQALPQLTSYVALGDSYSAGEGNPPFLPVPGNEGGCHQSDVAYSRVLRDGVYDLGAGELDLSFEACAGAKLKNIVSVPQDARGETHAVQLNSIGPEADLVTISVGGNDVGFSNLMQHCATQFSCWRDEYVDLTNGRTLTAEEYLITRVRLLAPELRNFYTTLRERAGDDSTIVVVGYPEFFDDGLFVGCKEVGVFSRLERSWINNWIVRFDRLMEELAADAGVHYVSVVDVFKGHRVCEGGDQWLTGHELAARKNLTGDASFHPTEDGQRAYASAIADHLNVLRTSGVYPLTTAGLPVNPGVAGVRLLGARSLQANPPSVLDEIPTLADLGMSPSDVDAIQSLSTTTVEIIGLSATRGDATCSNVVALGEHVIIEARGFLPNSIVDVAVESSTAFVSDVPNGAVSNSSGTVRFSLVIPDSIPGSGSNLVHAAVQIRLEGESADGGQLIASTSAFIDTVGGECSTYIEQAGDVSSDGGAAPSAATTPDVPTSSVDVQDPTVDLPLCGGLPATILGTEEADYLEGTPDRDVIVALGGNDIIRAFGGNDIVCGGEGRDRLFGGEGNDWLSGGLRNDIVKGDQGSDALFGNRGNDRLFGGPGSDTLTGGSGLRDRLFGKGGQDACIDRQKTTQRDTCET
ncbi:MAG: hypothetical protein HKN07_07380 [Acidimicrobiia bacterium]|nr:hypothetical protein [Acidimicrobiia bacterium]